VTPQQTGRARLIKELRIRGFRFIDTNVLHVDAELEESSENKNRRGSVARAR
jgi:hypothetical protein